MTKNPTVQGLTIAERNMLLSKKFYPFLSCASCFVKDYRLDFLGDFLYPQYYGKPRNEPSAFETAISRDSCEHWNGDITLSQENIKLTALEKEQLLMAAKQLPTAMMVRISEKFIKYSVKELYLCT